MPSQRIANHLTKTQRDCLIEHVHGPQPFHTNVIRQTKQSLVETRLLRPPNGENMALRPTELMLSELGREVVCIILGEYADALVACGLTEPLTESQVLAAIEEASKRKPCPERLLADAKPFPADAD